MHSNPTAMSVAVVVGLLISLISVVSLSIDPKRSPTSSRSARRTRLLNPGLRYTHEDDEQVDL